jgi:hypothetical protein
MGLKVLRYDDAEFGDLVKDTKTNDTAPYIFNKTNWGTVNWKLKQDPGSSNTGSFITGHKYRIHWGQVGIDFDSMRVELDEHWMQDDKSIYFVHNFTDVRAAIDVTLDG